LQHELGQLTAPRSPRPALQYVFAALYLATQAAVLALYVRAASLPPWTLALLAASRRLHSIFVLRLFNDCWAMAAAYLATLAPPAGARGGGGGGACVA
jgi:alpha-1,3-mannosyltransferase